MVHIQPSLIKLAGNTPTAFNTILKYLNHEDKRKLFLTSKQLQDTLKMYQQLKQFTSQTLTFRFPQTPFHKKGKPHYGKPNNIKPIFITKHVNPQASLTECHTCDTLYYNAKFEKTFLSCDQHAEYRWEKANPTDTINNRRMIIAEARGVGTSKLLRNRQKWTREGLGSTQNISYSAEELKASVFPNREST